MPITDAALPRLNLSHRNSIATTRGLRIHVIHHSSNQSTTISTSTPAKTKKHHSSITTPRRIQPKSDYKPSSHLPQPPSQLSPPFQSVLSHSSAAGQRRRRVRRGEEMRAANRGGACAGQSRLAVW
ncbi:hypothetical protein Droror1_Dr00017728 [Drosera rotundifolia]